MKRLYVLRRPTVLVWLAGLLLCAVVIGHTSLTADLSAFLPRSSSAGQHAFVDQLHEGLMSHLILISIDDDDVAAHATLSKQLVMRLRADVQSNAVNNNEPVSKARDR